MGGAPIYTHTTPLQELERNIGDAVISPLQIEPSHRPLGGCFTKIRHTLSITPGEFVPGGCEEQEPEVRVLREQAGSRQKCFGQIISALFWPLAALLGSVYLEAEVPTLPSSDKSPGKAPTIRCPASRSESGGLKVALNQAGRSPHGSRQCGMAGAGAARRKGPQLPVGRYDEGSPGWR